MKLDGNTGAMGAMGEFFTFMMENKGLRLQRGCENSLAATAQIPGIAVKPKCNQNATIDQHLGADTMASVTIKNIPEELYAKLKAQAKHNHRSINGEVLHCLEEAVRPKPWALSRKQKLELVRRGRVKIDPDKMLTPEQIKAAIEEGRE